MSSNDTKIPYELRNKADQQFHPQEYNNRRG